MCSAIAKPAYAHCTIHMHRQVQLQSIYFHPPFAILQKHKRKKKMNAPTGTPNNKQRASKTNTKTLSGSGKYSAKWADAPGRRQTPTSMPDTRHQPRSNPNYKHPKASVAVGFLCDYQHRAVILTKK
jgi:hypothetical protein